jgi:hypothetical protein
MIDFYQFIQRKLFSRLTNHHCNDNLEQVYFQFYFFTKIENTDEPISKVIQKNIKKSALMR